MNSANAIVPSSEKCEDEENADESQACSLSIRWPITFHCHCLLIQTLPTSISIRSKILPIMAQIGNRGLLDEHTRETLEESSGIKGTRKPSKSKQ